jgi:hypothetical protein
MVESSDGVQIRIDATDAMVEIHVFDIVSQQAPHLLCSWCVEKDAHCVRQLQSIYYRARWERNRFKLLEKVVFTFFRHYLQFITSSKRPWEK